MDRNPLSAKVNSAKVSSENQAPPVSLTENDAAVVAEIQKNLAEFNRRFVIENDGNTRVAPSTDDANMMRTALPTTSTAATPGTPPTAASPVADERRELTLSIHGRDRKLVAGLNGSTNWSWLYVRLLWVSEEARGQGLGKKLMNLAEDEARKRGCKHAWVDTFNPEALKFYQQLGYQVFGELPDCPPGGCRFFLRKSF